MIRCKNIFLLSLVMVFLFGCGDDSDFVPQRFDWKNATHPVLHGEQTYRTPNYPDHYPNKANDQAFYLFDSSCTSIKLLVNGEAESNRDYIEVYDKQDRLACIRITGSHTNSFCTVHGNWVELIFTSDYSVQKKGYEVKITPQNCTP